MERRCQKCGLNFPKGLPLDITLCPVCWFERELGLTSESDEVEVTARMAEIMENDADKVDAILAAFGLSDE